jgi:hypothetical protein
MKKLITLFLTAFALQHGYTQNIAESHLLKHYFELKDALVNSDAPTAAYRITDVTNAGDGKIAAATKAKLLAAGRDLEKQRAAFAILSLEVYQLIKREKPATDTIYQAYCPMKKSYWLSKEPVIKNPYYGKVMLNCGAVTETIKP